MSTSIIKVSTEYISSEESLFKALGVTKSFVKEVFCLPELYEKKEIQKKDGSIRVVYAPHKKLKAIQRRVIDNILADENIIQWPEYLYGSLKNTTDINGNPITRDYVACASKHSGAKSLLTVDIKNFFDNVHEDIVEELLKEYVSKEQKVVNFLLDLCCHNGCLVQGAPTSSYLANMSLYDVEPKIVRALKRKNLIYTRFVDDITVSTKVSNYDFTYALRVIEAELAKKGLFLNHDKTSIRYAGGAPLTVHGLRVDFHNVRLPAKEVKSIRANVKMIENMARNYKVRTSFHYRSEYARCMGRVNKLKRTGHQKHDYYMGRLKRVQPIPSRSEIEFLKGKINKLVNIHPDKGSTLYYKKQYYWVKESLYVLRRSFPRSADEMMDLLKQYRPIRSGAYEVL